MGSTKVTNTVNVTNNTTGQIVSWSVTYKVEYRVKGDVTWIDAGTVTVTHKARQNFRRIFSKTGLSPARYEIRVTKTSANPTVNQTGDIHLTAVDEIRNENIAYVNSALLAIHMQATDQISGEIPNISCLVNGLKVVPLS